MSYELDVQLREIAYLLDEFRDCLRRIQNFNSEDRQKKLHQCAQLEQQFKTTRAACVLELRAIEDPQLQNRYKNLIREKNAIYKNLVAELESRKSQIDREQLNAEADEMAEEQPTDHLTLQQAVVQGNKIQDETQESVVRMKKLVADAEQIGLATAEKMDAQIAQMGGVSEALNDVEYNVKRARQTAKTIAKNAASDRCIQILCGSIFLCIIIIIIMVATK